MNRQRKQYVAKVLRLRQRASLSMKKALKAWDIAKKMLDGERELALLAILAKQIQQRNRRRRLPNRRPSNGANPFRVTCKRSRMMQTSH